MHVRKPTSTASVDSGCEGVTATLSVYDFSALPFRLLVQVMHRCLLAPSKQTDLAACLQAVELLLSSKDENEDEDELQARVAAHLYFSAALWGMLVGGKRDRWGNLSVLQLFGHGQTVGWSLSAMRPCL